MAEDCQKKAAELGFDVSKQFLSLALAGIAFVVGLSFNAPGAVSTFMFWFVIAIFGGSAVMGLLFLMRGVGQLSIHNSYDVYDRSLRILSGAQILLVIGGVVVLLPILESRPTRRPPITGRNMEIRIDPQQSVIYPIDPDRSITIELESGKIKVTTKK